MAVTLLSVGTTPFLAPGDAAAVLAAVVGGVFLAVLWVVGILLGAAAYFAPTIVAALARGRHLAAVAVINAFLGWSLIGWVVALALAFAGKGEPRTVVVMPQAAPTQTSGSIPALPAVGSRSPEGLYWWDGRGWQSVA
jgi:hypothetical protein